MNKVIQVRVTALKDEKLTWAARGIRTAQDIRAAVVRAVRYPDELLLTKPTLPPEIGWEGEEVEVGEEEEGPDRLISWHVRFSTEEVALLDSARGPVDRSRWIADVISRTTRTALDITAAQMAEMGGSKP